MTSVLIQIVPALPPAINGVGDYALGVARMLRSTFGVDSIFVVGNDGWQGEREIEGFAARRIEERTPAALAAALEAAGDETGSNDVLLQLSGYGYSRRGCPRWLLEGVTRWKARARGARLVTMFHELYASGAPWKSAFWLSGAQKRLVRDVALCSEVALTNIGLHRERLESMDASKIGRIETLAVPSNVGEPESPAELRGRQRRMVVFGRPGSRRRSYQRQAVALRRACAQLGITEVCDVGEPFAGVPDRIGEVAVRKLGALDRDELSALLLASMAGYLSYERGRLGKSGVLAAYCAHRMLPVAAEDGASAADGIAAGEHYYVAGGTCEACPPMQELQAIADRARAWYNGHALQSHARALAAAFEIGVLSYER